MSFVDQILANQENVQPLKGGRNVARTAFALSNPADAIAQQERAWEKSLDAIATHPDPIILWEGYITWIQGMFPSNSQGKLVSVLERATRSLVGDSRYKNDERYISLWVSYADLLPEPADVFKYLHAQRIGEDCALTYMAWAWLAEHRGNYSFAEKVYARGVARSAQPLDRMKARYAQFQRRMYRKYLDSQQGAKTGGAPSGAPRALPVESVDFERTYSQLVLQGGLDALAGSSALAQQQQPLAQHSNVAVPHASQGDENGRVVLGRITSHTAARSHRPVMAHGTQEADYGLGEAGGEGQGAEGERRLVGSTQAQQPGEGTFGSRRLAATGTGSTPSLAPGAITGQGQGLASVGPAATGQSNARLQVYQDEDQGRHLHGGSRDDVLGAQVPLAVPIPPASAPSSSGPAAFSTGAAWLTLPAAAAMKKENSMAAGRWTDPSSALPQFGGTRRIDPTAALQEGSGSIPVWEDEPGQGSSSADDSLGVGKDSIRPWGSFLDPFSSSSTSSRPVSAQVPTAATGTAAPQGVLTARPGPKTDMEQLYANPMALHASAVRQGQAAPPASSIVPPPAKAAPMPHVPSVPHVPQVPQVAQVAKASLAPIPVQAQAVASNPISASAQAAAVASAPSTVPVVALPVSIEAQRAAVYFGRPAYAALVQALQHVRAALASAEAAGEDGDGSGIRSVYDVLAGDLWTEADAQAAAGAGAGAWPEAKDVEMAEESLLQVSSSSSSSGDHRHGKAVSRPSVGAISAVSSSSAALSSPFVPTTRTRRPLASPPVPRLAGRAAPVRDSPSSSSSSSSSRPAWVGTGVGGVSSKGSSAGGSSGTGTASNRRMTFATAVPSPGLLRKYGYQQKKNAPAEAASKPALAAVPAAASAPVAPAPVPTPMPVSSAEGQVGGQWEGEGEGAGDRTSDTFGFPLPNAHPTEKGEREERTARPSDIYRLFGAGLQHTTTSAAQGTAGEEGRAQAEGEQEHVEAEDNTLALFPQLAHMQAPPSTTATGAAAASASAPFSVYEDTYQGGAGCAPVPSAQGGGRVFEGGEEDEGVLSPIQSRSSAPALSHPSFRPFASSAPFSVGGGIGIGGEAHTAVIGGQWLDSSGTVLGVLPPLPAVQPPTQRRAALGTLPMPSMPSSENTPSAAQLLAASQSGGTGTAGAGLPPARALLTLKPKDLGLSAKPTTRYGQAGAIDPELERSMGLWAASSQVGGPSAGATAGTGTGAAGLAGSKGPAGKGVEEMTINTRMAWADISELFGSSDRAAGAADIAASAAGPYSGSSSSASVRLASSTAAMVGSSAAGLGASLGASRVGPMTAEPIRGSLVAGARPASSFTAASSLPLPTPSAPAQVQVQPKAPSFSIAADDEDEDDGFSGSLGGFGTSASMAKSTAPAMPALMGPPPVPSHAQRVLAPAPAAAAASAVPRAPPPDARRLSMALGSRRTSMGMSGFLRPAGLALPLASSSVPAPAQPPAPARARSPLLVPQQAGSSRAPVTIFQDEPDSEEDGAAQETASDAQGSIIDENMPPLRAPAPIPSHGYGRGPLLPVPSAVLESQEQPLAPTPAPAGVLQGGALPPHATRPGTGFLIWADTTAQSGAQVDTEQAMFPTTATGAAFTGRGGFGGW